MQTYINARREQILLTSVRIGHSRITHKHILERTTQSTYKKFNATLTNKQLMLHCQNE